MTRAHTILFVEDQVRARDFYAEVLAQSPRLDVPGMSEFALADGAVLGLMPRAGIERLLGDKLPPRVAVSGSPESELYLLVENPSRHLSRAIDAGANLLSDLQPRDWGHEAGYCMTPDGHLLAFAKVIGD